MPPTHPARGAKLTPKLIVDPEHRYIMVRNRALDPFTGQFVATYGSVPTHKTTKPIEGRPGWYRMDSAPDNHGQWSCMGHHINPTIGRVENLPFQFRTQFEEIDRAVQRLNDAGTELWRFAEPGQLVKTPTKPEGFLRNHKPQSYEFRDGRLFLGYDSALVALDFATGVELWRVPGSCHHMLAADDHLLAAQFVEHNGEYVGEIRAVDYTNGSIKHRVHLGKWDYHGPRFQHTPAGDCLIYGNTTKLLYGDGRTVEVDGALHAVERLPKGQIIGSSRGRVACWSESGRLIWTAPFVDHEFYQRLLLVLPDGDVIACEYETRSRGDTKVVRLDCATGTAKWTTTCDSDDLPFYPPWRGHSDVYVELIAGNIVICCQGMDSSFVEVLDPANGRQLRRWPLTTRLAN